MRTSKLSSERQKEAGGGTSYMPIDEAEARHVPRVGSHSRPKGELPALSCGVLAAECSRTLASCDFLGKRLNVFLP